MLMLSRLWVCVFLAACHGTASLVQLVATPQTVVVGETARILFQPLQSHDLPRIQNPVYNACVEDMASGQRSSNFSCDAVKSALVCQYTFPTASSFSVTLRDNLGLVNVVTILAFIQPLALFVRPSRYSLAGADFFTIKLAIAKLPVLEAPTVLFKVGNITYGKAIDADVVEQGGHVFLSGRSPSMGKSDLSGIEVYYSLNSAQFSRAPAEGDAIITAVHQKPYKIGFIYHQALSLTNGWIYQQNLARLSLYSVFGSRIETVVSQNMPDKGRSQCPEVCDGPNGWCTEMDGCAGKGLSHFCYVEGKRLIEEEDVDMVVGVTFWYWPDLAQLSKEYPTKKFLSTAPGSPAHLTSNFARGWLRRYQAHYMMGFVLGHIPRVLENRRVGYVASFAGASKIAFGAFMKGLQEASGFSDFTLYVTYTLSWGDARRERIAAERFFKYYNVSAVGTICNTLEPYFVARDQGGYSTGNNLDAMQAVGPSVVSSALFSWDLQTQLYVGTAMAGIPWGSRDMNDTGAASPPLYSWFGRDMHGFSMAPFSTEVPPEAHSLIKAREEEFAAGHDDIWCGTLRKPGKETVRTPILNSEIAAGECMGGSPSVGFVAGWENVGIKDDCADDTEKINGKCYVGTMDVTNDVPSQCPPGKGMFIDGCVDCPVGTYAVSDECIFCSPGKYGNVSGLEACLSLPQQATSEQRYEAIGGSITPPKDFSARADVGLQACEESCTADGKCVGFFIHKDAAIGSCWLVHSVVASSLASIGAATHVESKYIFYERVPIIGYIPIPCPLGTYGSNFSGPQCTDCDTTCTQCERGKYADKRGMFECIPCGGDLTTESAASLSQSACLCASGYYRSADDRVRCLPCKEGMSCKIGSDAASKEQIPVLESGFWSDVADPLSVFQCSDEKKCIGGNPLTDRICAPNMKDFRCCERCLDGYTWDGVECTECTGYQKSWLWFPTIAIASTPVIICTLYKLFGDEYERWGSWKNGIASIGFIVLNLYQTLSLTPNINMLPPENFAGVLNSFHWLTDATELFKIECTGYGNFKSKVIIRSIGPAVIGFAYLLTWWLSHRIGSRFLHCSTCPDVRMEKDRTLNGFFSIIFTFFAGMSSTVLMAFMCSYNPNGERTLTVDRSVLCDDGEWKHMVIITVLAALVWILGFLVCFIYAICVFKARFSNPTFQMRWKFLFIKFRPDVYWWAIPVLAKGVMVNVGLIVINSAIGQIVWLLLVTIIYLNLAVAYRPWRHVWVNLIEVGAQECLVLVCAALMFFVSLDAKTNSKDAEDDMQMVSIVFVFLVLPVSLPVAIHLWWSGTSDAAQEFLRSQAPAMQESFGLLAHTDSGKLGDSLGRLSEWDIRHLLYAQKILSRDFYKDLWRACRKTNSTQPSHLGTGSITSQKLTVCVSTEDPMVIGSASVASSRAAAHVISQESMGHQSIPSEPIPLQLVTNDASLHSNIHNTPTSCLSMPSRLTGHFFSEGSEGCDGVADDESFIRQSFCFRAGEKVDL